MSTHYSFITRWQIKAPLKDVWWAIYEAEKWPEWWPGVLAVKEIKAGNDRGIGGIKRYTWKSALPYQLSFNMELTDRVDYKMLTGRASGELEGTGTWHFEENNGITDVTYYWDVVTHKKWMNFFSFALKPLYRYNHNIVMKWGAKGLSALLHAQLISS